MKRIFLLLALTYATYSYSSGSEGHGSATDLIAPLVNVLILVAALVWKLRTPLNNFFNQKSELISNTLERANLKSKEAEVMLNAQERKITNLDSEIRELQRQNEQELKKIEKNLNKELEDKIFKLKSDATLKIEAEKKIILQNLSSSIIDEVIQMTKKSIKSNKELQTKASGKLIGEMLK